MSEFNDWFCSLPEGRQAVLRDDKWRLADNAFQAGFEQAQAEIDALKAQNAGLIAEMSEALGDETLNSLSQVATGIRDLQSELAEIKAQNAELLAENKQIKHLADPARERDIQELCAGLLDGCDEYIWNNDWARNKYECKFCLQSYDDHPKHDLDCIVLIAQDLMTIAKVRGVQS